MVITLCKLLERFVVKKKVRPSLALDEPQARTHDGGSKRDHKRRYTTLATTAEATAAQVWRGNADERIESSALTERRSVQLCGHRSQDKSTHGVTNKGDAEDSLASEAVAQRLDLRTQYRPHPISTVVDTSSCLNSLNHISFPNLYFRCSCALDAGTNCMHITRLAIDPVR